ncbi:hypothetical protein EUGRSUZ_H02175 [Eucalyptus grandis]|uniref:Uncharacterized protein n=2 Tax=Eucalyptus grandis TaxID=71139 RepID=A0ACC3JQZ3_EUCGR|nr:hypothetical protein EUGRSUZ_H02175 [Eucalyptus grandis]
MDPIIFIPVEQKRERVMDNYQATLDSTLERSFLISSSLSHSKHMSEMRIELPYFNMVAFYLYLTKARQKSMS